MIKKTALEIRDQVRSGMLDPVDVFEAFLAHIRVTEPNIKAFITVLEKEGRAMAERVRAKQKQGEPLGRLCGVPIALKDNLCTRGIRTTCASKMLENFRPPYDAAVVERMAAEDAVFIGKTNLDEFAMGSSTENSAFFTTHNPWDLSRVPGGSSGGSAAAVAARMAPLSLGSDTGGSIRQPASLCGVLGLKPTYGSVSRYGLVAFASSLDQIGPFAANTRDLALLQSVISGPDARDSTSAPRPAEDLLSNLTGNLSGLRVGLPRQFFSMAMEKDVEARVREGLKALEKAGAKLLDVELPHVQYSLPCYYIIAPAEASSNLARYDGAHYGLSVENAKDIVELFSETRARGFGAEVKRRVMLGAYTLSSGYFDAYYLKAAKVRTLIRRDYQNAFEKVDLIAGPTAPTTAFKIGEKADDPVSMYLSDIYTLSLNLAGMAGLSVPVGLDSKRLPVGLQLQSNDFGERQLLEAAFAVEREIPFHQQRPDLIAAVT